MQVGRLGAAASKRIDPTVKILLFSAYVNLPEEELRWVGAYATKGDHPKTPLCGSATTSGLIGEPFTGRVLSPRSRLYFPPAG
jgi:hypothetical protein